MVEEFKRRRDIIVAGLNDIPGIRCPLPLGAFYVFPSIEETEITSQVFAESLLSEAGVASLAGESFGRFGNGYIRFSFANSVENLEIALERIRNFVRSR
jgi:aspartate/methionine/tyrosine aminotransferase